MPCTVVVGGFFGDEGKGKFVSYLALREKPSIVARGGLGPNAGHTVTNEGRTYALRLIPSGFVYEGCRLLIGPGVALNPAILLREMEGTGTRGRVGVDYRCAVIEERHIELESRSEHLSLKIGSTKSGVGACNSERALRRTRLARDVPELKELLTDVPMEANAAIERGESVILEGTQGTFLSLYHGTYPYCTSKDTTAAAVCSDVGIGPTNVDEVLVVFKAYVTRVGEGPLDGELPRDEVIRMGWQEFGTVTGRERRVAPFNFELAKRAVKLNGATQIAIAKIDSVFPKARGMRKYDELPAEAKSFIESVEEETGAPVTLLGTGPSTLDVVDRRTGRAKA